MKNIQGLLLAGCSALALAGCGPDDIASPGSGGNVIINNPTPTPTASPTGGLGNVTPASDCPSIADPQGLTNAGTITGPTGTWRVCRLPSLIKASINLPKVSGVLYEINGRVNVGCDGGASAPAAFTSSTVGCTTPLTADTNVTLTIQPGAILYGNTGQSWIAVNRGNKINAQGTSSQPIIFTSRSNVEGVDGNGTAISDATQGQWGGVVLLGRGIITGPCDAGGSVGSSCERKTEGAADLANYGGNDNAYNAGSMRYVQIRYSGFVLGAGKELQGLTTGGTGTGTTLDHIQIHNSSDDGAEFFGGAVNLKYYIATGADDDSVDADVGAQMNLQHAILVQRSGKGDALFEIDSNGNEGDTPRTKLDVSNFIALQPQSSADNEGASGDLASLFFRGNSDTRLANGIIVTPNNECLRMNGTGSTPATLAARSVVMQCNSTKYLNAGTGVNSATSFGTGSNNNNDAFTNTLALATLFVNGANEDGVVAFNATAWSSFFDLPSPNRIGAAWSGNTTWYAGWTCNSSTANFGASSGSCTSLPTS